MKKLLALALVAVMAGGAMAQGAGTFNGGMGVFFSDTEFTDANTNLDPGIGVQFQAYLVVIDCGLNTVGGYECGLELQGGSPFILGVSGPNGWQNFGTNTDHQVGYTTPLPVDGNRNAVLMTFEMLYTAMDPVDIVLKGSVLQTLPGWDGPVLSDGSLPDDLYQCFITGNGNGEPTVAATLYGAGVTATESRSLSSVKSLFE